MIDESLTRAARIYHQLSHSNVNNHGRMHHLMRVITIVGPGTPYRQVVCKCTHKKRHVILSSYVTQQMVRSRSFFSCVLPSLSHSAPDKN